MKLPLQTTIRDIPGSAAIESDIYKKAKKLNQFCNKIMACRVVLESLQRHQRQGKLYNVRLDITVPGEEIVINRNRNEDMYVALRDAFDSARRQLESYCERLRQHGKEHTNHKIPLHGYIEKLFPDEGYGFIETWDGHEVYFNECTVLHTSFNQLRIGQEVHFIEEMGQKGPQALRVKVQSHTTH